MSRKLLVASEVAERLRVSVWHVQGLCRSGKLRAAYIGAWKVEESAVAEFIAANTREPAPEGRRRRRRGS